MDGWKPMATYFKKITGIDPFTVDQHVMTEHASVAYENPYYQIAVDEMRIIEPTIFQFKNNSFWVEPYRQGHYDVQVFHPRSRYQNGRPNWLLLRGTKTLYPLAQDTCQSNTPCLVQAFFQGEGKSAVPADQVMIAKDKEPQALALPHGHFWIKVMTQSGKPISQYTIELK
jgi:hypothetical protein